MYINQLQTITMSNVIEFNQVKDEKWLEVEESKHIVLSDRGRAYNIRTGEFIAGYGEYNKLLTFTDFPSNNRINLFDHYIKIRNEE